MRLLELINLLSYQLGLLNLLLNYQTVSISSRASTKPTIIFVDLARYSWVLATLPRLSSIVGGVLTHSAVHSLHSGELGYRIQIESAQEARSDAPHFAVYRGAGT